MHPTPQPLSSLAVASLAALSLSWNTAARVAAQEPDCAEDDPRVVGYVVDAGTELPLASVLVSVNPPDRASLTTDNGRFLLCEIGSRARVLTAARLGYDTLMIRVQPKPGGEPIRLRLEPDPIILEGLEIVTNRFERRRRAVATSVRSYDREMIARSGHSSAAEFVDSRAGVVTVPCPARRGSFGGGAMNKCVFSRGGVVRPVIYLDEARLMGGWYELDSLPAGELHMVEIYGRGRHIRAYTHGFMGRAAKTRLAPLPLWF